MSDYIDVMAIVEGKTEQIFVQSVLAPYLAQKNIFMVATQVSKPGQKGGDVRFERVKNDLRNHLKQRSDTYVTTFVDYYGTKDWPGLDEVAAQSTPLQIAECINQTTQNEVDTLFSEQQSARRFIPYIAVHEFEALLFSDSTSLVAALEVELDTVSDVLDEFGEPEAINNHPQTAPSKRLDSWSKNGKFPKTTQGIALATEIGITKMREKCPVFNAWIVELETLVEAAA